MQTKIRRVLNIFFVSLLCILFGTISAKAGEQEIVVMAYDTKQITKKLIHSILTLKRKNERAVLTVSLKGGKKYSSPLLAYSNLIIYEKNKLYFIRENPSGPEIVEYNTETAKEKILKSYGKKYLLKDSSFQNLVLEHATSDYLYYSLRDLEMNDYFPVYDVYRVGIDHLKSNLVVKEADRLVFTKNRMIYYDPAGDFGPMQPHSVLLNGKGKKTLKQWVINLRPIKNKLYYVAGEDGSGPFSVYRANNDFTKIEKLSNEIKTEKFDNLYIVKITDKKVYYAAYNPEDEDHDYYFVIDLKTKKTKKLKGNVWDIVK